MERKFKLEVSKQTWSRNGDYFTLGRSLDLEEMYKKAVYEAKSFKSYNLKFNEKLEINIWDESSLNDNLIVSLIVSRWGVVEEVLFNEEYKSQSTDKMKILGIRDAEAGNHIDSFLSMKDAVAALCEYEAEDARNGEYEENFYEIYLI